MSLSSGALNRLRHSEFVRNVAVLMSGTAMGQAITLAAAPVLSRLYSPDDFGILGLYVAASMILGAAASWKYNMAIVLPKDDADAANVLALSCLLVVFMAIATAVVLALAENWIIQVLDNTALEMFIWWLPFSVIIGGSYEVIINWANRYKEYKNIAFSEILRSGGTAGTQALASLARLGPAGLVAGNMAGYSLAAIMLGWRVCYRDRALIFRSVTVGRIAGMAREHYHFPVYNLPQALLLTSSRSLPIFLFTFLFDPAVAGLYWFTARIVSAPGRLIAGSVGRVFYQKAASKLHRGEEILPHLRSVTLVLSAIGILPVAILWAFGPLLFSVVFGESWYQAGIFAQWVVVAWFFGFISAPSFTMVPILRLQHISLVYNAGLLVCRSIAIPLGAWAGDELTAVSYFALVGATFSFSFMIYIFIKVGKNRPRG